MRGTLRDKGAWLAVVVGPSWLAQTACNELIGATDPIPESEDSGATMPPGQGMDATAEETPEAACPENTQGCSDAGLPQTCRDGGWVVGNPCPNLCEADSGTCGGECPPHTRRCTDAGAEVCGNDGMWGAPTACQHVCVDDQCNGECTPQSTECWTLSTYKSCDDVGQWGNPQSCMMTEICRMGTPGCVDAVHDVGWDTALMGTFTPSVETLYVLRLPALSHSAVVNMFGVYGTMSGTNARLALYKDNGSGTAPTGLPIDTVSTPLALGMGQAEQYPAVANVALDQGATYWLGIVFDSSTSIAWAADPNTKGLKYTMKYLDPYPDLGAPTEIGYPLSGIDLGIYINVQDTN
jgi:hypothetical protein